MGMMRGWAGRAQSELLLQSKAFCLRRAGAVRRHFAIQLADGRTREAPPRLRRAKVLHCFALHWTTLNIDCRNRNRNVNFVTTPAWRMYGGCLPMAAGGRQASL